MNPSMSFQEHRCRQRADIIPVPFDRQVIIRRLNRAQVPVTRLRRKERLRCLDCQHLRSALVLSPIGTPALNNCRSGREMPFETAPRTSQPFPKSSLAFRLGSQFSNSMSRSSMMIFTGMSGCKFSQSRVAQRAEPRQRLRRHRCERAEAVNLAET